MRKPRDIARYSPGLALAALTTVTILALVHVAMAQAQVVTPSWTAATALPTLHANGKIAFTSNRDGNREIYVMNADGTNQVRLTNNTIVDDHPTWSPDGLKIAFVSERTTGGRAIFTMNPDGTGRTEVTPVSYVDQYANWPYWIWTDFFSMDWSPDGKQIVFQDNYDIVIVNADGSNRHAITDGTSYDLEPAWSPDGSKIVFSRDPIDDGGLQYGRLSTTSIDGSNIQFLPNAWQGQEYAPKWSPLGDKILFVIEFTDDIPDSVVYITNADGSNDQLFDATPGAYEYRNKPSWSPDGRKILFDKWIYGTGYPGDLEIYVKQIDGGGSERLTNTSGWNFNPSWQPLAPAACPNPIDCADFFVRQHYLDFLNRQPDADGLAFWTNEITPCGVDPQCIAAKRINVSAAFFLSIEFQQTGYFVYRIYKASYGNLPGIPVPIRLSEFLPDAQQIGQSVIVRQAGWETVLENNQQTFVSQFVQRSRFTTAYPTSLSPGQFVDALFANAGITPASNDRAAAINEFGAASTTADVPARARALRRVAENTTLAQQEFNRAFVLMQYFGYLRRNPNDAPEPTLDFQGYNFWLNKLDGFRGNFIDAEMVRAFIDSAEYRKRFGP